MPPNTKGGKQYKKKAKGADQTSMMIERQEGQQIARVIKILGNRCMSCYCNDNTVRVCRVRGKMRGRDFVDKGDVVLISLREFETDDTNKTGDILAKYPHDTLSKLKKEDGINEKLFAQLELLDGSTLGQVGQEDAWEFEAGSDEDEAKEKEKDDKEEELNIDDI